MSRGFRSASSRAGELAAATLVAVAVLCVPAAGAQQPTFQPVPESGSEGGSAEGIVTERLEPLAPSGERTETRDSRFKPAPFKTPEAPMVPELIPPVETELKAGARLRQLDKMTGKAETVEVAAGDEVRLDRLRVRVEACRAPADNGEHGTKAFLKVWDSKDPVAAPVFSGWMFAESPALSAMDHPRYDVWVMSCTTSSGEGSSASR